MTARLKPRPPSNERRSLRPLNPRLSPQQEIRHHLNDISQIGRLNAAKKGPLGGGANLPWFSRCVRAWLRTFVIVVVEPLVATQHPEGRAARKTAASHQSVNPHSKMTSSRPLNCFAVWIRAPYYPELTYHLLFRSWRCPSQPDGCERPESDVR